VLVDDDLELRGARAGRPGADAAAGQLLQPHLEDRDGGQEELLGLLRGGGDAAQAAVAFPGAELGAAGEVDPHTTASPAATSSATRTLSSMLLPDPVVPTSRVWVPASTGAVGSPRSDRPRVTGRRTDPAVGPG
jgi:hypothetical protein